MIGVVDAHATEGGEHMFGGRNERAIAVAKHGCEVGRNHRLMTRGNLAIGAFEAGADENDAGVGVCRIEGECRGLTGMNADASQTDGQPKRRLPAQFHHNVAPTSERGRLTRSEH
jgi:hypothetical protein